MYYVPRRTNWKRIIVIAVLAFSLSILLLAAVPLMRKRQAGSDKPSPSAPSSGQLKEQARISGEMEEAQQALRKRRRSDPSGPDRISEDMRAVQKELESKH